MVQLVKEYVRESRIRDRQEHQTIADGHPATPPKPKPKPKANARGTSYRVPLSYNIKFDGESVRQPDGIISMVAYLLLATQFHFANRMDSVSVTCLYPVDSPTDCLSERCAASFSKLSPRACNDHHVLWPCWDWRTIRVMLVGPWDVPNRSLCVCRNICMSVSHSVLIIC
jgi:hypothetical protein